MTRPLLGREILHSTNGGTLAVQADRGGKIVSLKDRSGTEWLTTSERISVPSRAKFGEAEMAGWDECMPTITACTVDGHDLPDHGDAWNARWSGRADALETTGSSWPYRLRRRIRPTVGGGWRIDYSARTTGSKMIPFLWAAHPQFSAPEGTRVELAGKPTMVDVLDPSHPELLWSSELGSLAGLGHRGCRKLYVHPDERVTGATLVRPDRSALRLRWSCDYLGLWFDNSAWAAGPVIAIEPALAYADSLEFAVQQGTAASLLPGSDLSWWVEITFESEIS